MTGAARLADLLVRETSGVDHPAHLHEGWLVMKSATPSEVDAVLNTLSKKEKDVPDTETDARIAALQAENARLTKALGVTPAPEPTAEDLLKAMPAPVIKMIEDERAKAAAAVAKAAEVTKALEAGADREAVTKAKTTWGALGLDAGTVGPALRRLAEHDADLHKAVTTALDGAVAKASDAALFKSVGTGGAPLGTSGSAYGQMTELAKAAVTAGKAATIPQAMADVAMSHPDLYRQYLTEKG